MQFLLVDFADNKTGKTGALPTLTVSIAKNGGQFVSLPGPFLEIGEGWYSVPPNAANYDILGPILLHAEAFDANPTDDRYDIVEAPDLIPAGESPPAGIGTGAQEVSGNDLVRKALKHLGVISGVEDPSEDEFVDAFGELNQLIDEWKIERLTIHEVKRVEMPVPSSKETYTLGPGGDFDVTPRPDYVGGEASIISLQNPVQPLELALQVLNVRHWRNIPVKNILSALPTKVYIDGAFPLRNLVLWPIPAFQALRLVLYLPTAVNEFPDRQNKYIFPPGYVSAMCWNLADRCAPMFGKRLTLQDKVPMMAAESLGRIKRANINDDDLGMDPALVGTDPIKIWDWRSGSTAGSRGV